MGTQIKITNEDEAWALFERLESGDQVESGAVVFEGWPKIKIKVKSSDRTISSEMMEAFLEYQDMIYRSAGLIIRGKDDLRKQSLAEKEALEIRVKVTKGSTISTVDLTEITKAIAKGVDKMDANQLTFLLVGAGLLWTASTLYKTYMNNKLKDKELDAKERERASFQTQQLNMSQEETKRAKLMASAIHGSAIVAQMGEISESAAIELFEIASTEGPTKVAGVKVTDKRAELITKRNRRSSDVDNIEANFKILKMDGTVESGFKAQFQNQESNDIFTAGLTGTLLSGDGAKKIFAAFESKSTIKLNVSVKTLDGHISSAEIISVM